MSLFDPLPLAGIPIDSDLPAPEDAIEMSRPLAERMRPRSLDEYVGQEHIIGPGTPLRIQLERGDMSSLILWGPPGSGKTTLASLLARHAKADFVQFSAVLSGIKEIKAVMADAQRARKHGRKTVLFIDEIHRFNKAQQDAFLPYVERGDVILVGATTENPSFEVVSALLSRTKVYVLRALDTSQVVVVLRAALRDSERGLGKFHLKLSDELSEKIAVASNGDARSALNTLELTAQAAENGEVSEAAVAAALQKKVLLYDKNGEEHFNLISALHKSVRSSDADAALYWLARMMHAGEDRMYLARRLVRMAIEDIGLADPNAVQQSIACMQTVHFLGEPEGDQALAQLAIYLALAPKSDAAYQALNEAARIVSDTPAWPAPLHIRNAPTGLMKSLGYGKGYKHAHSEPDAVTDMECLPVELSGTTFYKPSDRGFERKLQERLQWLTKKREKTASSAEEKEEVP